MSIDRKRKKILIATVLIMSAQFESATPSITYTIYFTRLFISTYMRFRRTLCQSSAHTALYNRLFPFPAILTPSTNNKRNTMWSNDIAR